MKSSLPGRLMMVAALAGVAAVPARSAPATDAASASTPAAQEVIGEATGAALQADAARALRLVSALDPAELAESDRQFRVCIIDRFGAAGPSPRYGDQATAIADPFAREALGLYQSYWRASMLRPEQRGAEETKLAARLARLLGHRGGGEMKEIEPLLAARLKRAGYHSLQGRTGVLRELMLWTKQETRDFRVELPEGAHTTRVHLLDGFASLGWGFYGTCGRRGTGGWATSAALYAVVPRYPGLESEEFRVTFLGHETQHFADFARFPGLASWELEYRAKLTELALAVETRPKILRKFTEDQGSDPASPHSFANRRVLGALRARLGLSDGSNPNEAPLEDLRRAAVEELRADSARRTAR